LDKKNTSTYTYIEIQHALMLAEISLLGLLHAQNRLLEMLNNSKISIMDKNLLLYDFLEEALIRGKNPFTFVLTLV